jgi:SAM-dependent methyltransferase
MVDAMNDAQDPLEQHKQKWETLANENDRYYVRSVEHQQSDEEYETSGFENVRNFIEKDPIIHKHLFPFSDKKVLEIGCGSGRITKSLCRLFEHVHAVDISPTMLRKARDFVASPNVTFIESDGSNVPVSPNSVDFAFSYIVYQHFPSREAIRKSFEGVSSALRPGGIFKVQIRGERHPDPQHWSWGPDYNAIDAKELASQSGFQIISMAGQNTRSFWLLLQKRPR